MASFELIAPTTMSSSYSLRPNITSRSSEELRAMTQITPYLWFANNDGLAADPERAERARQAMFTMRKIDIATIQEAANR